MRPRSHPSAENMIQRVGIISRPRRDDVAAVVPKLLKWLGEHGLEVFYDQETATCIGCEPAAMPEQMIPREQLPGRVDVLIVLGGDGTLLAAARITGEHPVPILPVNMGGLGFLTSVTLGELYPILEEVLTGRNRISERVQLQAEVLRDGKSVASHRALNDAVLNKGVLARMIDLDLHIDGGYVCSYKADGLIVSTPTGSTAYSLSAGGPIIFPSVPAICMTPICPHMLTNRPVLVPATSVIRVTSGSQDMSVYLTIDGQVGTPVRQGDTVVCRCSPFALHLIRPPKAMFFDVLRQKLKWGER